MQTAPTSSIRIGGVLIGYHVICHRKAWLHYHGMRMEQESQQVALGRLLDETSYRRRKKPEIVETTAPDGTRLVAKIDGVDLKNGVLHETKKGRSCEDAHFLQLRFYLWVLKLLGVTRSDGKPLTGQLDYPALRRTERVALETEHEAELQEVVAALVENAQKPAPPPRHPNRAFCRKCAFETLCYA